VGLKTNIVYTNYPQNNPEYAGAGAFFGGDEATEARFLPIYELLNENWQIDLEFIATYLNMEEEVEDPDAQTIVTSFSVDKPDFKSIEITFKNSNGQYVPFSVYFAIPDEDKPQYAEARIKGTYDTVFDQRQYDLRMPDETLLEDANLSEVRDNYYAPYNYVPDLRVWLENGFTFNVRAEGSLYSDAGGIFSQKQTVLNNWEANRRKLIEIRDNLNRGEQLERNAFSVIANSPEETFDDPNVPNPPATIGQRTYSVPAAPITRVTESNPNVAN
jgi:hypothetical protein